MKQPLKKKVLLPYSNKKVFSSFRPKIRSRHPSHNLLRSALPLLPFKSVVRLGSTTDVPDAASNGGKRVECNTIEAIRNSSSKLRMKECFEQAEVKTAFWCRYDEKDKLNSMEFPIVAKHIFGSRGTGNTLIKSSEELESWLKGKQLNQYIFEKFYNYGLEFRLHVTEEGCFYSCRKALKSDVPESEKWRRHDDICVWYRQYDDAGNLKEDFQMPNSWQDIETDCIRALKAVGADILSFDVRVQSAVNNKGKVREYQDYILIECNSASSLGDFQYNSRIPFNQQESSYVAKKYVEEIPKILKRKFINSK